MTTFLRESGPAHFLGASRWRIVAACFACLMGEAVGTYVFTPMLKPIVAELGWTRTQFTLSGLSLSLVMMAAAPAAGMLTDRGHGRPVLAFGALCLGTAMYLFSLMATLRQFYLITMLMGLGVACVGAIPTTTVVSRWFDEGRGLALAIVGIGHSFGGLVIPPLVTHVAATDGWRAAFRDLSYLVWLVILPVVVAIVRDRHARNPPRTGEVTAAIDDDERVLLRDGIRSPAFWLLATAMVLHIFYFSGVAVHFIAYATDVGIDAQTAATAFGAVLGLGIVGRPVFGWAADRFRRKTVIVAALLLTAVASLLLQRITSVGVLATFVAIQGLSVVGVQVLFAVLVGEIFGTANVGTFLGATMLFQVPGGVLGAIIAAASFDRLGTYAPAFWLCTAGNVVAALAISAVQPYNRAVAGGLVPPGRGHDPA